MRRRCGGTNSDALRSSEDRCAKSEREEKTGQRAEERWTETGDKAETLPRFALWTPGRARRSPTWQGSTPPGCASWSGTGREARWPARAPRPSSAPCGRCMCWTTGWRRWWPAARSPERCSVCREPATPRARCSPPSPSDGWTSEKRRCWTVSTMQVGDRDTACCWSVMMEVWKLSNFLSDVLPKIRKLF